MTPLPGVSFVLPVRNGARWLARVLDAIRAQRWPGAIEIIAVDDGSTDASPAILQRVAAAHGMTILNGAGQGAAAALNRGIRAARYPFVAQVDQDVVLHDGWLQRLMAAFDADTVAAAQGRYVPADGADRWARVMALDLAVRYDRLGARVGHVCTGNTVYRRAALLAVDLFDERLGYGYDNDMSYRLTRAGYELAFVPAATSVHFWREGLTGYARQQYGFGYGRLDLLRKHRGRVAGDDVSRLRMMAQAPATAAAMLAAALAGGFALAGVSSPVPLATAAALGAALAADRAGTGLAAAVRFRDPAGLWFLPVHAVRNGAWVWAIGVWMARRLTGRGLRPADSMRPRPAPEAPCASSS
jgi:hypothetical protein